MDTGVRRYEGVVPEGIAHEEVSHAGSIHHNWPSFCSIWSEVWMALEFSS
jgi:hypothetical protein